jgi:hypothetical protein
VNFLPLDGATEAQTHRAYLHAATQAERLRSRASTIEAAELVGTPEALQRLALAFYKAELAATTLLRVCKHDLLKQADRASYTCPQTVARGCREWRFRYAGRRFLAVEWFDLPDSVCREVYDLATDCCIVVSRTSDFLAVDDDFVMEHPNDAV